MIADINHLLCQSNCNRSPNHNIYTNITDAWQAVQMDVFRQCDEILALQCTALTGDSEWYG